MVISSATRTSTLKQYGLILLATIGMGACGGGSSDASQGDDTPPSTTNQPPTVTINPLDSTPRQGQTIRLTATAIDSDGSISGFKWQQTAGPILELAQTDQSELSMTLNSPNSLAPDAYRFRITVTDNLGATATHDISFNALKAMSSQEAARLLHQSTLGPTGDEILHATGISEVEWIDEQIQMPITSHLDRLENYPNKDEPKQINRIDAWWKASLHGQDQLRQRVAFALSEIFVVSDANNALAGEPEGMTHYYDLLAQHAFGNYRDLLQAVTLSPVMGTYLSHLGNEKADPDRNIRPDENYAREVMQLFSVGLNMLNNDGSPQLDSNGHHIPTYSQAEIEGFAHVFTGWTFAASARWNRPSKNYVLPMEPWSEYHSNEEKTLLQGVKLPAGQSAEQDLQQALDNLFQHPNVGPFIAKQLIQRLVTSNPTPQFVDRITRVFNDDGNEIRGNLGAVIKAILLDDEARQTVGVLSYLGKIREPLLRTVQLWRELNAESPSGNYFTWSLSKSHGQAPLGSPSVFNFFRPDYQPADLQSQNLVAPELQIANDAALLGQFNSLYSGTLWSIKEQTDSPSENRILLSVQPHVNLLSEQGIQGLLDYYDTLFYSGSMSSSQRTSLEQIYDIWSTAPIYSQIAYLLFAISVSPEYLVQL